MAISWVLTLVFGFIIGIVAKIYFDKFRIKKGKQISNNIEESVYDIAKKLMGNIQGGKLPNDKTESKNKDDF